MKKQTKTKKPEHQINNEWLRQCLVLTTAGEIFRFKTPQDNHIVADATHKVYNNWEAFDQDPDWNEEKLREEYKLQFKKPASKKHNKIDLSTSIYSLWASRAADRTEKPVKEGSSPKLKNRTYFRLHDGTENELKTPQAKACLEIIDKARGEAEEIPEEKLKKAFIEHRHLLKTRQDPWRIFQYYRGLLVTNKVIRYS